MFDPESNPDYRNWLNQPPKFWEDLGQRHAQQLKQVASTLTRAQLERIAANVVIRAPLEGERAQAFRRGLFKGYFPGEPA